MPKVSVSVKSGKLYLLGRFPPKDNPKGDLKQARIPTGLDDTAANRKVAEKRRAQLQRQVDEGIFDWGDWVDETKGTTWKVAIDLLYRKRVVLGKTGENTWNVNYMGRLRQVPMTQLVTTSNVAKQIERWERNTASYKEVYFLFKDICQLANVTFPEVPTPTYKKSKLKEVPTDKQILALIKRVDPVFGWYLGMMATYGLRPHETDGCQFEEGDRLWVPENTKTGERIVVPLLKEWVELWDLTDIRRYPKTSTAADATSQWLHKQRRKYDVQWQNYSLRHSYAGRLWKLGGSKLDIYTAARLMGHSPEEHAATYRRFIEPHSIAERVEDILFGE